MKRLLMGLILSGLAQLTAYDLPNEFQIRQEPYQNRRVFRILDQEKMIGYATNSERGKLKFYGVNGELKWVNDEDLLYTAFGEVMGSVDLASDSEWFGSSTKIEIAASDSDWEGTCEVEGDGNAFVFRDRDSGRPLAIAIWKWVPKDPGWIFNSGYFQEWAVFITDWEFIKEKQISPIFFIWPLLKHSQKNLPSEEDAPYTDNLPKDSQP